MWCGPLSFSPRAEVIYFKKLSLTIQSPSPIPNSITHTHTHTHTHTLPLLLTHSSAYTFFQSFIHQVLMSLWCVVNLVPGHRDTARNWQGLSYGASCQHLIPHLVLLHSHTHPFNKHLWAFFFHSSSPNVVCYLVVGRVEYNLLVIPLYLQAFQGWKP